MPTPLRFTKQIFAEFRQISRDHGLIILAVTLTHLITNAAFTAFAEMAARHLHFGPGGNIKAFGLVCNAPLTASMAVLIATLALERQPHQRVIDHHFFWNWLAITILLGWANSYAWFANEELAWRFAQVIVHYPPLTNWLELQQSFNSIPAIINIMITTVVMLSVPVVVIRRQPLFHHHAAVAVALVAAAVIAFNLLDQAYKQVIDQWDIYRNWTAFPGFTARGFSYDRLYIDFIALPVALPAWIVTVLLATSAVKAARKHRDALRKSTAQ